MKLLQPLLFDLSEKLFVSSMLIRSWPCFPASAGTSSSEGLVLNLGASSWGFVFQLEHSNVEYDECRTDVQEGLE